MLRLICTHLFVHFILYRILSSGWVMLSLIDVKYKTIDNTYSCNTKNGLWRKQIYIYIYSVSLELVLDQNKMLKMKVTIFPLFLLTIPPYDFDMPWPSPLMILASGFSKWYEKVLFMHLFLSIIFICLCILGHIYPIVFHNVTLPLIR